MPFEIASRSLASLRSGEPARVASILFDSVRDHCASAGLREGSLVVGRGTRGRDVALEIVAGEVVVLDGVLACFVQVVEPPTRGPYAE